MPGVWVLECFYIFLQSKRWAGFHIAGLRIDKPFGNALLLGTVWAQRLISRHAEITHSLVHLKAAYEHLEGASPPSLPAMLKT